ncbi:Htl1p NDAI_0G04970 [Naumovozyma dairenensis CBS 421]|uniref:Uncharacterized protein n=1 Tax=Naumovozyma dairenensis (strain ATCC 10597 / BCRC 20456 / CBS 421 / NBRC 0211 / NRRL Y-12639) TaxID=1071378 RepID=J7SBQ6_NAUDC|nr:hypothetical protein NDAI_0G04970 [Naumovozyma dairenensis CBS 421]CCK73480.1 hypothetical protein NDAI_0G04970 [Naumovozyma dairenensis CBS 421]
MSSTPTAGNRDISLENDCLKTLTAHELLSRRENMCELFNLVDDSQRRIPLNKNLLEDMKARLEKMKNSNDE